MTPDVQERVIVLCSEIGNTLGRKYKQSTIVDGEDIRQELWMWAAKRPAKIAQWLNPDQDEEDYRRGENALRKSLYRQGDRFCRTAKARRAGYEPRDEAFYTEALLDDLLPEAWSELHEVGKHHEEGPRSVSNPSEGGNFVTSLIDVRVGLSKLDKWDFEILAARYRDGVHPQDMAEDLGVSRTTVDRRVRKALRALTNKLGGESPWGY